MVAALAVFAAFASGFAWRSSHGLRSGSSVEADKAADLQARGSALELLDEALRARREQRINGALSALDRARRTDPSLPGVDVSFAALALGEKQFAEMRTAAIAAKGKKLPLEFRLLEFAPEPWTPSDVLAFGRFVGFQMSYGWLHEIVRMQVAAAVGAERLEELSLD